MCFLANMTLENNQLSILFVLGVVVFGGMIGAKLFQFFKFPQVIGYIIIGLLIGQSGFKLITSDQIKELSDLNFFALGIIGFMIGGELKADIFKKFGKQFILILLGEGIAAFLLVGTFVSIFAYLFTSDIKMSVALGVVLGAISSATDPASTIQVLWEYKTRGSLTTATTAVVALDDALALTLYGLGVSIAGILTGNGEAGLMGALGHAGYELGGAVLVGVIGGLILSLILKKAEHPDSLLGFALGAVLIIIGISEALKLDIILASMALGLTFVNLNPRRSKLTFEVVKKFAPPIYVLFFVFVGAGIEMSNLNTLAWILVAVYVVGRSVGKVYGSMLGARFSKASPSVRKYLGYCLFAQGGVAVGLSLMASQKFAATPKISAMIVVVVTTTTLIVQLLGPMAVKHAVKNAGEINMDVTEEDLIKTHKVGEIMLERPATISQEQPFDAILNTFSTSVYNFYPVVDHQMKLVGSISLRGIKEMFAYHKTAPWLLACDIMEPVREYAQKNTPLEDAMKKMYIYSYEYLCVIEEDTGLLCGMLSEREVTRRINAEVLRRREEADKVVD